ILWPKFEDQEVGKKLAVTGAIKDTLLYLDDIVLFAMDYFREHYPGRFAQRYKLNQGMIEQMSSPDVLLEITKKHGFRDDYERAAEMIIQELRKRLISSFTLELPYDIKIKEKTDN